MTFSFVCPLRLVDSVRSEYAPKLKFLFLAIQNDLPIAIPTNEFEGLQFSREKIANRASLDVVFFRKLFLDLLKRTSLLVWIKQLEVCKYFIKQQFLLLTDLTPVKSTSACERIQPGLYPTIQDHHYSALRM